MKKVLSVLLVLAMLIGCTCGLPITSANAATKEGQKTVTTVADSALLDDLMAEYTSFVVIKQKQLGGSHYAYTEGLSDDMNSGSPEGDEAVFNPGSQMILLELEKSGTSVKKTETILIDSPDGVVRDPDVSEDGGTILFSWKKNSSDDFHLYEYYLKTGEIKQLTYGTGISDTEPNYTANGKIIFSSSRIVQTIDCWKTAVSNMYTCDADGGNIVRLGYDQVHTTYPTTTSDGRVLYTRWDYNDRNQMYIQSVFQMFPDGTGQTELYGNDSNFPTTLLHTREIPGTTDKYISIASGHHVPQAGKLVILDTSVGRNSKDAVTLLFPDTSKNDNIDAYGQNGALYKYPYALNENEFLVSCAPNGWESDKMNTHYNIYMMNTAGEKVELVNGSDIPASQIKPIATHTLFERASMVNYGSSTGTYYIGDIYEGEGLEGVARGEAKYLRVVALEYRSSAIGATTGNGTGSSDPHSPIATGNGAWDVKKVLGITPIEEDGSAMFTVPSETPVYFQVLNADGDAIQSMRSWSTLMPGETFSCVGCHEDKNTVPPAVSTTSIAMSKGVKELQPDFWQSEDTDPYDTTVDGFDYLEEVQPILDESCVECHSNTQSAYETISASGMNNTDTTVDSEIISLNSQWKYTTASAGSSWMNSDFDDSAWSTGTAPFGTNETQPGNVGTIWDENKIYMRSEFNINQYQFEDLNISMDLACVMFPTVYINGVKVYSSREELTSYKTIEFTDEMRAALKQGTNTIAISATHSADNRNFVGLTMKAYLDTSEAEQEVVSTGSIWKFKKSTSNNVESGWNLGTFDDSSWMSGLAPFGDRTGYATAWNGSDKYIWIRKTFNIDDVSKFEDCEMVLNTFYDDNPIFYLNGHVIYTDTEGNPWVDNYTTINLGTDYAQYLVNGENVFAIQCSNDTGGRQIDSSLTLRANTAKKVEVMPTNADGWKYVIDSAPASTWMNEGFDDSAWTSGKAGFGDNGSTRWAGDNSDIWIRRTFTVSDLSAIADMKLYLELKYDEDPIIYINGTEVFSASGYIGSYKSYPLDLEYTKLLKEGENTIAIYAHNSVGGSYIDCGINAVEVKGAPISFESTGMLGNRMKKFFPLSYLVLTGSTASGSVNWVGNSTNSYTNWISSMSQCEMLEPYSYGAFKSTIIKKLRAGHGNLTDTQIRTIAAWIDLGVPAYGNYENGNNWGNNEIRWSQEYNNKRSFYNMMNSYSRLFLSNASAAATNLITVDYAAANGKNYSTSRGGIAVLEVDKSYAAGDKITVTLPEGEKYLMLSLNSHLGESMIYCPDGKYTFTVPSATNNYPDDFSKFATNTITARVAKDSEKSAERVISQNVYDLTDAAASYPHAIASTMYNNNSQFIVRNAIDGFTANNGHGDFPVQSWGPDHEGTNSWMQVDFGREVNVNKVEIYIRADFPHDVHYLSATLEFSDGSTQDVYMTKTNEGQVFTFDTVKTTYVKLKNLVPATTNTSLWEGISEFQVYGSDIVEVEPDPTTTWSIDEENGIVYGMSKLTSIQAFKNGFSTEAVVTNNGAAVTDGNIGTGMTVQWNGKTYTAAVVGDLDGDGNVTVSDVVALRKSILSGSWSKTILKAGDLSPDNNLTVSDVVELRKVIMAG